MQSMWCMALEFKPGHCQKLVVGYFKYLCWVAVILGQASSVCEWSGCVQLLVCYLHLGLNQLLSPCSGHSHLLCCISSRILPKWTGSGILDACKYKYILYQTATGLQMIKWKYQWINYDQMFFFYPVSKIVEQRVSGSSKTPVISNSNQK